MPNTPLFGLRWVPDAQLKPLRYIPNPDLDEGEGDNKRPWFRAQAERDSQAAKEILDAAKLPESLSGTPSRMAQNSRLLQQRLAEAQETVRQKSEQIRWLKEMTKDEARRTRVGRWLRGPLLRVFMAWKRVMREMQRERIDELKAEMAGNVAREQELAAQYDEMNREYNLNQTAIEHFFQQKMLNRRTRGVGRCWGRWAPLRKVAVSRTAKMLPRPSSLRRTPSRLIRRMAWFLKELRAQTRHSRVLSLLGRRAASRLRARLLRSVLTNLHWTVHASLIRRIANGKAPGRMRMRAAMRRIRKVIRQQKMIETYLTVFVPYGPRRAIRRAWSTWSVEVVRRLSTQRVVEATRAKRIRSELAAKEAELLSAQSESNSLRSATSLWGDDEMPAMLAALSKAAHAAEAAAGAEGPEGVAARREAAVAAASWQGTQMRLTVAVLDSLKRELGRERAALGSARAEAKQSDATAEQALAMLQELRDEGAALQERLAGLEAAKLRTEQALCKRDAELFAAGRASHQAARQISRAMAQVEEKNLAQLQRLESRCEARSQSLAALNTRVRQATERAREKQLDTWAKALELPLEMGLGEEGSP